MRIRYDEFYVGLGRSKDPDATFLFNQGERPMYVKYGKNAGALEHEHDAVVQPGERYRFRTYQGIVSILWFS